MRTLVIILNTVWSVLCGGTVADLTHKNTGDSCTLKKKLEKCSLAGTCWILIFKMKIFHRIKKVEHVIGNYTTVSKN